MNPACTWRFNAEYWGAIHSTKIPTGPTGKIGPPQKVDPFFRNFSGWTEPIHWVLDRNIPEILVEWIAPLGTGFQNPISRHCETRVAKIQGWRVPWKKKLFSPVLHFTCRAIGNGRYCCLNIGKFLLMILLTCSKFKQRNAFKKISLLTSCYHSG